MVRLYTTCETGLNQEQKKKKKKKETVKIFGRFFLFVLFFTCQGMLHYQYHYYYNYY